MTEPCSAWGGLTLTLPDGWSCRLDGDTLVATPVSSRVDAIMRITRTGGRCSWPRPDGWPGPPTVAAPEIEAVTSEDVEDGGTDSEDGYDEDSSDDADGDALPRPAPPCAIADWRLTASVAGTGHETPYGWLAEAPVASGDMAGRASIGWSSGSWDSIVVVALWDATSTIAARDTAALLESLSVDWGRWHAGAAFLTRGRGRDWQ